MTQASGKDYDPSAWARERKERIKRASELRKQRKSGSPDSNHTFKPQLQAKNDGATSRLPEGAKASTTRGSYDLSRLEEMEGAFAASCNLASTMEAAAGPAVRTGDSLDHLAALRGNRPLVRQGTSSSNGSSNGFVHHARQACARSPHSLDPAPVAGNDQRLLGGSGSCKGGGGHNDAASVDSYSLGTKDVEGGV
ncbi:unnamed protein product, partial [Choristocarpus tenellus]